MKDKRLEIYYDNDGMVPTVKRGVCVTPDRRLQLATVKRETEDHNKIDRVIARTREKITILQCVLGIFFGIGARVRHPKPRSEDARESREREKKSARVQLD
jgi:hypothetical protein